MDWVLLLVLLCILCMAAMVPMMLFGDRQYGRMPFWDVDRQAADRQETAHEILDRRYANGELTPERYQQMRLELDEREPIG